MMKNKPTDLDKEIFQLQMKVDRDILGLTWYRYLPDPKDHNKKMLAWLKELKRLRVA